MSSWVARLRSWWRAVRQRSDVEAEMSEEFGFHIEQRTNDLVRSGFSPAEARRRARLEFGSAERYKAEGRVSRGLQHIDALRFSWLDFKLGFRMLARYPGLTIVGGLAMAFAIGIGAGSYELTSQWVRPRLPLPDAKRLVGVQVWDVARQDRMLRALHDFVAWREQVESIEGLSAFRRYERNLIVGKDHGEPVHGAEMTASGFGVARVQPLLGRVIHESDERPGAPPVIVISYEVWQTRFKGVADVVGRTVGLGSVQHTVIGVMPKKFGFPVSQQVWTPLRLNVLDYPRGQSPAIWVVGRLARGVSIEEAQAELTTLGARAAADFPETHRHLRPRVLPYPRSVVPVPTGEMFGLSFLNLFVVMLVVLVCGNVALLMFARAATRESEIVVRNALGASRGRIITQLFTEALVLGVVGAVVGLVGARFGLRWGIMALEENVGRLPFWFGTTLSRATLLYAMGLTVMGAFIAGVEPALKVTRAVEARLRQASAGGGGLKFGGIWTVVIVAQVAVTVAFPATVFFMQRAREPIVAFDVGFKSQEYLSARLAHDGDGVQFRNTYQEIERRLLAEPAVAAITFADRLPRNHHEQHRVDVVGDAPVPGDSVIGQNVNGASVDVDYFDVLGAEILAGRAFMPSDAESGNRVVIVNQSFVARVLHGRNPIGRHIRFTQFDEQRQIMVPSPWHEIIGVVKDLGMNYLNKQRGHGGAGFYHPLVARAPPVYVVIKVRGEPASFAPRLQSIANTVDPTLRLYDILPMNELDFGVLRMIAVFIGVATLVSSVALLLSLAGIYAVMSFAVSRRTREIGVRIALGADARQVMLAVFRRPLMQVGFGVAVGAWLVAEISQGFNEGLAMREVGLVIAYAALMMAVCMIACIVPARRALAIEPTDALRDDG